MSMQILLLFQGIQTFALIVIALAAYNIWKKIEWEPEVTHPTREEFVTNKEEKDLHAHWKAAEKKFRAKVYDE